MTGVGGIVNVMKKENVTSEKIFADFLGLLEKDKADLYTGFLFEFISEVVAHTMDLGKQGYAPVMNFTLSARQKGVDGFELICHPSRSKGEEVYQKLKLAEFGIKVMAAFESFAIETWGMTPVIDEREDLRGVIEAANDAVDQWSGAVESSKK